MTIYMRLYLRVRNNHDFVHVQMLTKKFLYLNFSLDFINIFYYKTIVLNYYHSSHDILITKFPFPSFFAGLKIN